MTPVTWQVENVFLFQLSDVRSDASVAIWKEHTSAATRNASSAPMTPTIRMRETSRRRRVAVAKPSETAEPTTTAIGVGGGKYMYMPAPVIGLYRETATRHMFRGRARPAAFRFRLKLSRREFRRRCMFCEGARRRWNLQILHPLHYSLTADAKPELARIAVIPAYRSLIGVGCIGIRPVGMHQRLKGAEAADPIAWVPGRNSERAPQSQPLHLYQREFTALATCRVPASCELRYHQPSLSARSPMFLL